MHYSYNYYEALFLQLLKHKQVCKRDPKVQEAIKQLLEQSAMSAIEYRISFSQMILEFLSLKLDY